ncbi:adenylate kinase [Deferribacterales bacterium Es71-Z0220]|uniref:adenylate kinase n=1 Tax=Deferrivibrio essentukiensis TaxID=2880922 RepID=UPI001F608C90|nr:adenylate kinase [Deferrivibrio essentukiensis]MBZ4672538.1 adenylate kinase [Deferribacteraceae bacterium]MCB4205104.1 adenylate kinase [Deferrivibrio essentukiensis]
MINMIFLGPPGAGKGTQSANIIRDFNIVQISTGDILRAAVKEGTEFGLMAKKYMDEGKLVPDDVIIGIVKDRLQADDCKNGFILDGFPRTIPQAIALDSMLKDSLNTEITHIISLEVPDEDILERLTGRRTCENCKKGFHIKFAPSAKGDVCDECGGKLIQRDDDKEETIKKRLNVYHEQTSMLKDYYKNSGKLSIIDGTGEPDEIYTKIKGILS